MKEYKNGLKKYLKEKAKGIRPLNDKEKPTIEKYMKNKEIIKKLKYLPVDFKDERKCGFFVLQTEDYDEYNKLRNDLTRNRNYNVSNLNRDSVSIYFIIFQNYERATIIKVGYGIQPKRGGETVKFAKKTILKPMSSNVKRRIRDAIVKEFLFKSPDKLFEKSAVIEHFINNFLGIKNGSTGLMQFYNIMEDYKSSIDDFDKFNFTMRFLNRFIILFLINASGLIRSKAVKKFKKFNTTPEGEDDKFNLEVMLKSAEILDIKTIFEKLNHPEKKADYSIYELKFENLAVKLVLPYLDSDIFAVFDKEVPQILRAEKLFLDELFEKLKKEENRKKFNGFIEFLGAFTWNVTEAYDEEDFVVDPEILSALYEKVAIFFDVFKKEQIKGKLNSAKLNNLLNQYIANKQKGVYYTPKVITDYIAENTIIPWLRDRLKEERLRTNFENMEELKEWIKKQGKGTKKLILNKIKSMKILDPAVGSGAFLMSAGGILYHIIKACTEKKNFNPVITAKEIVTNNLYGVDILPGSIGICKLRMWLWILSKGSEIFEKNEKEENTEKYIDENIYKNLSKDLILPNIEYNFRVGNSLIGFAKFPEVDVSSGGISRQLKKMGINTLSAREIINIRENWAKEYRKGNMGIKEKLDSLEKILQEIFDDKFSFEYRIPKDIIKKLTPFHWIFEFPEVFLDRGGFDIVIGNPPYGKIKNLKIPKEEKKLISTIYKIFYKKIGANVDLYKMFLERSLQFVDKQGYFSFLMPIMFWGDKESFALRKEFYNKRICKILHFPLETTMILFNKSINYEVSIFILRKEDKANQDYSFDIIPHIQIDQTKKLDRLKGVNLTKSYIFENSLLARLPLFTNYEIEKEILEFLKRFKKFGNYLNGEPLGWIFVGKLDETNDKKYLSAKPTGELAVASNHIKDWFVDLEPKEEDKRWIVNGDEFRKRKVNVNIYAARNVGELMKISPKIIGREVVNRGEKRKMHFTIYYRDEILTNAVRIIILKDLNYYFNKTLLSIINSNLIDWFIRKYSLTYHIKPYEIEDFPIVSLNDQYVKVLSGTADFILFPVASERLGILQTNRSNFYLSILNKMIYELYFKEKFAEDGLYPESKEYLLEAVSKRLKLINYDRWAELYWKKQLEGSLSSSEEKELQKLEKENLSTIEAVYQSLKKDKEVQKWIEVIKSHEWVKVIEGETYYD